MEMVWGILGITAGVALGGVIFCLLFAAAVRHAIGRGLGW